MERRCVGCGQKRAKAELQRVVVDGEGQLVLDPRQRAMGRGAYLCGLPCLEAAVRRKAFGRAFRGQAKGHAGLSEALRTANHPPAC